MFRTSLKGPFTHNSQIANQKRALAMDALRYLPTREAITWEINDISINLLVVYRESVNLIGYVTRRLSADSLQF
mgnify:CR=1 FL=1